MPNIPWLKNIFQILIQDGGELPDKLPLRIEQNVARIKILLPSATHHLLCGKEIRRFIEGRFGSEVVVAYDTLKPYAYRADLARLCYLYEYGGLYADLSTVFAEIPDLAPRHSVAIFRDNGSGLPWGVANGVILAAPRRPEIRLAIDLILENVAQRWYGSSSIDPTGPNCFGRSFAAMNNAEEYWVGQLALYRDQKGKIRQGYFGPSGRYIGERAKNDVEAEGGNLSQLGLSKINNYAQMYKKQIIYGELEPVADDNLPAKWIAALPWRIEKEFAKFLCTIGLRKDGLAAWNHALRRQQ